MSNILYGCYILFFLVFFSVSFSSAEVEVSEDRKVLKALSIASEAALTQRDSDSTAEAGMIILDSDAAEAKAVEAFKENVSINSLNMTELNIEIVNNAPVTKFVNGDTIHFAGNGIIMSYGKFHQVREVDDR